MPPVARAQYGDGENLWDLGVLLDRDLVGLRHRGKEIDGPNADELLAAVQAIVDLLNPYLRLHAL